MVAFRALSSGRRWYRLGLVAALMGGIWIQLAGDVGGSARSSAQSGSWTTYGGNFARSSYQPISPKLNPLRHFWTSSSLSGAVYGEPLISGGDVFVATEADTVYALSARTGRVVWRTTLGAPVSSGALPCGDISPTVGVTSTMVLDPARGELFASAAVTSAGAIHHDLFGIDATTGAIRFRRDIDRAGRDAAAQLQRTGLGLDAGRVLIGFGGNYGDCSNYRGYLMAVPEDNSGSTLVYGVPTPREGAIWAPSGVTVETSGRILFATGNGASQSRYDEGDSVVEVSPSLKRLGYFAPSDWANDNANDLDLGSSGPVLVPHNQVIEAGKPGVAYLLNEAQLGGIGGQVASIGVCSAYGGDAVYGSDVFFGCPGASMVAIRVGVRSERSLWTAPSGVSGSPTVAGGLVWCVADGEVFGLQPDSGRIVSQRPAISTEHFAAPSAGDGMLVIGGATDVEAFVGPSGYQG